MWTLAEPEDGEWAIQHAKLIAVDDRVALVTSANFSTRPRSAASNAGC